MKNKVIVIAIAIIFIVVMGILGILYLGEQENNKNISQDTNVNTEVKGNYDAIEAMKHIETSNTIEELNNIIGFEAEKSDYSEEYTWKLDNKNSIVLKYAGDSPIIQANIDKSKIINEEVKFPAISELRELLNNGSFTYEELVSKLDGIEGVLAGKTTTSKSYMWVNKNEQILYATFNNESGKCTIASIR